MQVAQLWRYPFKSAQGAPTTSLELASGGVVGDRRWALIDAGGRLCSAKRYSKLLLATGRDDGALELDDGTLLSHDTAFSDWLHTVVHRVEVDADAEVEYEMTFEPPNDDAEYYAIPAPPGASSTSPTCTSWRRRRSRTSPRRGPTWTGMCAASARMSWSRPIPQASRSSRRRGWVVRSNSAGRACVWIRRPSAAQCRYVPSPEDSIGRLKMFHAMDMAHANHVGVYCTVITPGTVNTGDAVTVY